MTIGRYPAWSALKARSRAKELRRRIDIGEDPLAKREEERHAMRMSDLFGLYFKDYAEVHKKPRSMADDRYLIHGSGDAKSARQLEGLIGKHFKNAFVDAVSSDDVRLFHLSLKEIPVRANRCLSLLSKMFNLSEQWHLRPLNSNPCRHVKKYKENARDRHLQGEELERLGQALDADDNVKAAATVRLLLFTGMRVGELLGLTWADMDLKRGVARLADAKAGARDVQLPSAALAVISSLEPPGEPTASLLGLSYDTMHESWVRIRKAAGLDDVHIHDLRHTAGTPRRARASTLSWCAICSATRPCRDRSIRGQACRSACARPRRGSPKRSMPP